MNKEHLSRAISLIMAIVLCVTLAACGNSDEDLSATKGRAGNANYNIVNDGRVDEEDGWIYYSLDDGLYKCHEDGTDKTKLLDVNGGVYCINTIDDWIYFRNSGIYRMKTDGSSLEQICADDVRGGVHFVDGKIYNGHEYIMNFDGSDKERIYSKNAACGYTLNIVDDYIYFSDKELGTQADKVYRMKADGSDLTPIYDGYVVYMIVDGDYIYFSNRDEKNLCRMKTDGSEITEIISDNVTNIIVNDGWIYYISGGLGKVKIDGTEKQQLNEVTGITTIQLHGEWLYYEKDDSLYRIKIDGTNDMAFAIYGETTATNAVPEASSNIDTSTELIHSFSTKFEEKNAVTFPVFTISYPKDWSIVEHSCDQLNESYILTNGKGIEIQYSHIGGAAAADGYLGGSSVTMLRVEVTEVGKSSFIPGFVQGTDYSDLGEFCVAKLKVTGTLDMKTDTDFTDIDGKTAYAVVPKSMLGVNEGVTQQFSGQYAFKYGAYISVVAEKQDGEFTKEEEKLVISILSSFCGN